MISKKKNFRPYELILGDFFWLRKKMITLFRKPRSKRWNFLKTIIKRLFTPFSFIIYPFLYAFNAFMSQHSTTMDAPYWKDDASYDYYEKRMWESIGFFEKHLGKKIDWKRLKEILVQVDNYNHGQASYLKSRG